MACEAYDRGDVEELRRLADAVLTCEAVGARSVDDLSHAVERLPEGLDVAKAAETGKRLRRKGRRCSLKPTTAPGTSTCSTLRL